MGLSVRHMNQFQIKRIWNTVIIENLPQLCMQFLVTMNNPGTSSSDATEAVTYLALVSSFISIFIAFITFCVERRNIKQQKFATKFTITVISPEIEEKFSHFKRDTYYLRKAVAQVFPLDPYTVEILTPLRM